MLCKAATTSLAIAYRTLGSFSKHLRMIPSRPSDKLGAIAVGFLGESLSTASMSEAVVSCANARAPVAIS